MGRVVVTMVSAWGQQTGEVQHERRCCKQAIGTWTPRSTQTATGLLAITLMMFAQYTNSYPPLVTLFFILSISAQLISRYSHVNLHQLVQFLRPKRCDCFFNFFSQQLKPEITTDYNPEGKTYGNHKEKSPTIHH